VSVCIYWSLIVTLLNLTIEDNLMHKQQLTGYIINYLER
jgi:hypothetical protein